MRGCYSTFYITCLDLSCVAEIEESSGGGVAVVV